VFIAAHFLPGMAKAKWLLGLHVALMCTAAVVTALAPAQPKTRLQLDSTLNSVIVVSVGLPDTKGKGTVFHPCSESCISSTLWGDVARVFAASSNGTFGFAPPPVSQIVFVALDPPVRLWDACGMADKWFHAARAKVPNITQFTARVFLYPAEAGGGTCTAGGFSNVGCTAAECNSWLRGFTTNLVVHELGHLLTFSHTAWDANRDGAVSDEEDDGDSSDPMTTDGTPRGFAMPNRLWAGWANCAPGFPASVDAPVAVRAGEDAWCKSVPGVPRSRYVVSTRAAAGVDRYLSPQWAPALYLHRQNLDTGKSVCVGVASVGQTVTADAVLTATLVAANGTDLRVSFGKCLKGRPKVSATATAVGQGTVNVTFSFTNTDLRCLPRSNVVARDVSGTAGSGCRNLTVAVRKDNSPAEIAYSVHGVGNGNGDASPVVLLPVTNFTASEPVQRTSIKLCGPTAAVVTFWDTQGDGYCCNWGPGAYFVYVNGDLVATGGKFGFNATVLIDAAPAWRLPGDVHPGRTVTASVALQMPLGATSSMVLAVDGLVYVQDNPHPPLLCPCR
jgi:hypothetical protein